jgi:hypothetical protein
LDFFAQFLAVIAEEDEPVARRAPADSLGVMLKISVCQLDRFHAH